MADWSKMPFDLLYDILMRFEDLAYFSDVCCLWNHNVTMIKNDFNVKTTPLLLLAEYTEDNPDCQRRIFNPITEKCYQSKLPEISKCRCWGTAYGWIVILTHDYEFYLLNPLTKARMSLPPPSSLPYKWVRDDEDDEVVDAYKISDLIIKASALKVDEDNFIVFVTYLYPTKKLAFAKPGDRSWKSIESSLTVTSGVSRVDRVAEVVCRDAEILILYQDASILYVDVRDLSDPEKFIVVDYFPKCTTLIRAPQYLGIEAKPYVYPPPNILDELTVGFALYLVLSGDDLFMVVRDRYFYPNEEDEVVYQTAEFFVYQLDFDTRKWFQVYNLGDVAFYVGNNSSMAIHEIEAGYCNSNYIYYTDDACDSWNHVSDGGHDMGIFELEKRELYKNLYSGRDRYSKVQTPLWFIPQFNNSSLDFRFGSRTCSSDNALKGCR